MSTKKTTPYRTKEGDRWEDIAEKAYGNPDLAYLITDANKDVILAAELPGGLILDIPVLEDQASGTKLPSWMGDEDDIDDTPEEVDPSIPIVVGPPQQLAFASNYPIVEDGKRIKFAINLTGSYPYSVEKQTGGVVFSSPLYAFTAGFAIVTPDIQDGGYYIVKVGGTLVSGPLTIIGTSPLAFTQLPVITKVGAVWQIKYSINKTGTYVTKIIDLGSNSAVYNQSTSYTSGLVVTLQLSAAGNYRLEVGSLTYNFTLDDQTETTTPPPWLTNAGYKYDNNSHDFTLSLGATENVEVNVTAVVGTNPSGKDQDNNPWNSGTYNPGATSYVLAPYTERFSFNPLVASSGGLEPGKQYKFRIRRTSTPGDIFVLVFTMPTTTSAPGDPTPIDLGTPSTACPIPPTIQQIVQADSDNVTYLQAAGGVSSVYWRVVRDSDDAIMRSGDVTIFDANGVPQFNPSNQITVGFSPLADGAYSFQVQGKNCTSAWSAAVGFTVSDGVVPSTAGLEVCLYANDGGTAEWKVRVNGTAPYDLIATDGTDEIYSTSSTSDEIEIPNSVMTALGTGRLVVTVIDADNKQGTVKRRKVERDALRVLQVGYSVANGGVGNHINMMNAGIAAGLNYTGVIFDQLETDAMFTTMETTVFDHDVSTTYNIEFDETVHYAATHGMKLRVGVLLCRDSNKLNNGSTRVKFYGEGATMKRPDGVTPIQMPSFPVPSKQIPSPSSDEFLDFAKRYGLAFCKHFKKYIKNGTILFCGYPIGSSAESEYPPFHLSASHAIEGDAKGDFHSQSISRFKARHPEYTATTNDQIAAADLNGSPLALAWTNHLGLEYARMEATIWDYIYSQIPDLDRDGLEQIDTGSNVDELAPRRRTLNVRLRMRPTVLLVKTNDDTVRPADTIKYILDHNTSLARLCSACSITEPSPAGADFTDPINRAYTVTEMQLGEDIGNGTSFVTENTTNVNYLLSASGIVAGALLKEKPEFEISGSDKLINRLSRNISDVYKTGALGGGWQTAWAAFKTAESLTNVDTLSIDDVDPTSGGGTDPGPGPGPGPGPDPGGTGVWIPVIAFYGFIEHCNITVTGFSGSTSEDWRLTDSGTITLESGREWWYIFDTFVYKTSTPISNFPYQSNFPLFIKKMGIKIGTDTLYRWANPGETQYIPGFSDPNLGQGFSPGVSGAAVQIGFQEQTTTTPPTTGGSIAAYLESNASSYLNNIMFDIRKTGQGTVYTHTKGSTYNRNDKLAVASLSKSVTAATILSVYQSGLFASGLNTTVGSLISSWNSGAKANITLKQIITHVSGIPDDLSWEGDATLESAVNNLAGSGMTWGTPGATFAYSTVAYQVAARMCEIVTGKLWKVLWRERIGDPCAMGLAEYNPGAPYQPVTGNPNNPLAGYGLWCSQTEYSNFMQMVRDSGTYNGTSVLSPTNAALLWTVQESSSPTWGFGMIRNSSGNEPTSESAMGCYAWVNRSKGISCVLFTQSTFEDTIVSNNGLRDLVRTIY